MAPSPHRHVQGWVDHLARLTDLVAVGRIAIHGRAGNTGRCSDADQRADDAVVVLSGLHGATTRDDPVGLGRVGHGRHAASSRPTIFAARDGASAVTATTSADPPPGTAAGKELGRTVKTAGVEEMVTSANALPAYIGRRPTAVPRPAPEVGALCSEPQAEPRRQTRKGGLRLRRCRRKDHRGIGCGHSRLDRCHDGRDIIAAKPAPAPGRSCLHRTRPGLRRRHRR